MIKKTINLLLLFLCITIPQLQAQYFGRNKVEYKRFNFRVYETPHFTIYHYLQNDSLLQQMGQLCERWHTLHRRIFNITFTPRNPILIYQNEADFQQTTAISGIIGLGTGGVTEGLKNRVVIPLAASRAETSHVLGHEMVHAFQYRLVKDNDSTSINSIEELPLWIIEGMAEYMSLGSIDPQTAMWMRDAVLNDDIPSLNKLTTDPKYFPYRYGHAFWAYFTGMYGDDEIAPFLVGSAKRGYDATLKSNYKINANAFSENWKKSLKDYFKPYLKNTSPPIGTKMFSESNAGEMNLSPAISPDGKYMVFLSEKDLFDIDLYLADAKSGKIIKKLSHLVRHNHIDELSFTESAGAWSPDSKSFAFTVLEKGRDELLIADVKKQKIIKRILIPGLSSFSYPSWSPKGNKIVISGLINGQTDLFVYQLDSGIVRRLTNDVFADLQPSWSPDGNSIVFSSDRLRATSPFLKSNPGYNLSILDLRTQEVKNLNLFPGASNLNPIFSSHQSVIYFLSDRDGFRNLYSYSMEKEQVSQMCTYFTGISGITELSAALSLSNQTNTIAYSYYNKNGYDIYCAHTTDFHPFQVKSDSVNFSMASLPVYPKVKTDLVSSNIKNQIEPMPMDSFRGVPYQPKFKIDYLGGGGGVGIATGILGTGLIGGVNILMSDMLSDHQLLGTLAISGQLQDVAGQIVYLNQKHKFNFGILASHIPYLGISYNNKNDSVMFSGRNYAAENEYIDELRIFEDQVSLFTYLPLSQTRRVELGSAFLNYGYRLDRLNTYFISGQQVGTLQQRIPSLPSFHFEQFNLAYVGDDSYFGVTAPLKGYRYRFEVLQNVDALTLFSTMADYRVYWYLKPFSLDYRIYHYARYGKDSESDRLFPLFVGYPTLVHGFINGYFYSLPTIGEQSSQYNNLLGSSILVSNIEIRLPFTGPKRLSWITSSFLFTDLAYFIDAGVAWDKSSTPTLNFNSSQTNQRIPVFSTGLSLRFNVFGYLVLEPYYAIPFEGAKFNLSNGVVGLNFVPGW